MQLSHKIRLYPNHNQTIQLVKACGTARFTYNWALAKWNEYYQEGKKTTAFQLKKEWNQCKPEWVYDSPKDANQQPFTNLGKAFQRFFKKLGKYPTFKKKGRKDSFYVSNDKFQINGKQVKLPKIGWIKLAEELRFNGKITSGTVSRKADQWFISIAVDTECNKERTSHNKVGIDVGLTQAVTLSNGQQYQAPKPFKKQKKKIARLHRQLSRKVKGSNNRNKAKTLLSKAYLRLSNIRQDFWHKITSMICNENQVICVEDLNVKGMLKNRKLSFTLADVGLGEFFRQLDYKKNIWNNEISKVDRFFPSSQLCSSCGNRKKLSLSERVYNCNQCGVSIDRDVNAAKNIRTEGYSGIYACGQIASG
jgi:putative transposase